jgi:hypothetical protein
MPKRWLSGMVSGGNDHEFVDTQDAYVHAYLRRHISPQGPHSPRETRPSPTQLIDSSLI